MLQQPEKKVFTLKEMQDSDKIVITIYGNKGDGKTALALGFSGKIAVLCFDYKSLQVKKNFYNNEERISVYNAVELYGDDPATLTEDARNTHKYVLEMLGAIGKTEPDWIVFDGLEIWSNICEMAMRYNNGIKPFQGISNPNIWKERRMFLKSGHVKALNNCKKGLIYTTYTTKDEIIIDGTITIKKDIPKWIDAIMYETDVLMRIDRRKSKTDGDQFFVKIESSKVKEFPDGKELDITNKGVQEIVKFR